MVLSPDQTSLLASENSLEVILDPPITTPVGTLEFLIQKGFDTGYPSDLKTLYVELWHPCENPVTATPS